MSAPRITYKQWTRLYDLADEFYALSPWNWLMEEDLIALRHPETGEMAYMSLMGASGAYRCLCLYLGENSLHRFNLIHNPLKGDDTDLTQADVTNILMETRQLHASFETRDALEKAELNQIKRLKRRYRGDNWPQFQSYRPGVCPGPLNAKEVEWLTLALEQTLAATPAYKNGGYHDLLLEEKTLSMPCREMVDGQWQETMIPYDTQLHSLHSPSPSELLTAKVAEHNTALNIQCRFSLKPGRIGTSYGKYHYPYVLLVVDADSGFILGVKLLAVKKLSHDQLIDSIPDALLRILDQHQMKPAEIQVSDHTTESILYHTGIALKSPVNFYPKLPALDEAYASMPI